MITAETFTEAAKTFMDVRRKAGKDAGAVICLNKSKRGADIHEPQVGPWGAWRAYWKRLNYGRMVRFMDARCNDKDFVLTVPMLWPHEFDMEQTTVQQDHEAAEAFRRNYRPPRLDLADAVQRAATVAAWRASIPKDAKRGQWSPESEIPKPKFIDEQVLMESYERDVAEYEARKARKAR